MKCPVWTSAHPKVGFKISALANELVIYGNIVHKLEYEAEYDELWAAIKIYSMHAFTLWCMILKLP